MLEKCLRIYLDSDCKCTAVWLNGVQLPATRLKMEWTVKGASVEYDVNVHNDGELMYSATVMHTGKVDVVQSEDAEEE